MIFWSVLLASILLTIQNVPGTQAGPKPKGKNKLMDIGVRIVGGTKAFPNEFPYQLAMEIDGGVACGATILNEYWAITAAHCTDGLKPKDIKLIAGEHYLSKREGREQERKAVKIIQHDGYDEPSVRHDIALIKVDKPFIINKFAQPIPMAPPGFNVQGNVIVTGWGHTKFEGNESDVLLKVIIPSVENGACKRAYGSAAQITPMQICAGLLGVGGKDACQGDSGGPLAQLINGKYLLVGVVSFGAECAHKNYPGVYTSIAAYRPWIDPKIK